jgi:general stress protein YciG
MAEDKGERRGRGFAGMDPERQRAIASKGGRAAHAKGTAHEFTPDEAREAGRKGGVAVSRDRAHMSHIGREGGEARGRKARQEREGRERVGREEAVETAEAERTEARQASPAETGGEVRGAPGAREDESLE